jgi:hypothetical protein
MELHHLMALSGMEIGELPIGRISDDQHPQTSRLAPLHGGKESRTLIHRQEPGGAGNGHHADGIHARRRDGPCL